MVKNTSVHHSNKFTYPLITQIVSTLLPFDVHASGPINVSKISHEPNKLHRTGILAILKIYNPLSIETVNIHSIFRK
jgi:hypothetical protein